MRTFKHIEKTISKIEKNHSSKVIKIDHRLEMHKEAIRKLRFISDGMNEQEFEKYWKENKPEWIKAELQDLKMTPQQRKEQLEENQRKLKEIRDRIALEDGIDLT